MVVLAWILVIILAGAAAYLGYEWWLIREQLAAARTEITALRADLAAVGGPADAGWSPPGLRTAGRVVEVVVGTASTTAQRWREQGVSGIVWGSLDDFIGWSKAQQPAIARIAGPDGTVTIFFSDIEGSTTLNDRLGDERWVKVLAAHDSLVETYVDKHRGVVVKKQGDGYMVVFSTPELALAAATDIHRALDASWNRSRWLRRTPIRVRIGLHTGTAIERDGDFFGRNVAMAARIAGTAAGGEVLVSTEVAERLDEETRHLTEVGPVALKGFDGEHTLWRVAPQDD